MRLGVKAALAGGELIDGDVDIEDGVDRPGGGLARRARTAIAVPGFVDVHINGIAGVDFLTADPEAYRRAGEALAQDGRRRLPADVRVVRRGRVRRAARAPRRRPRAEDRAGGLPLVLGVHLEGPFLSPEWPGAHDPEHLRPPDLALTERLARRRAGHDHDARARAARRARADRLARRPRRRRLLRPFGRRRRAGARRLRPRRARDHARAQRTPALEAARPRARAARRSFVPT